MPQKVTVYTMDYCPYCERAKALLKKRGVPFEEIKLSLDDDKAWSDLTARTGLRTAPQIFAGDRLIGGFTDLDALDQKTELADLK